MMTKILVTGSGGCLGTALKDFSLRERPSYTEWIFLSHSQLDITQKEQVTACLLAQRPAFLVNTAAFTNVNLAEEQPQQAYTLNGAAPQYLAEACAKTGTVLIHLSTDYVFDGQDSGQADHLRRTPYEPVDAVNPQGVYGKSKMTGEHAVLAYARGVVVRTSWLYSESPASRNFLASIPKLLATKETPLCVEALQRNAPTYAPHLARALSRMMEVGVQSGLYHGCGTGGCSRLEFAQKVRDAICRGKCPAWKSKREPVEVLPLREPVAGAPRPLYSVMSNQSLVSLINEPIPTWEEAMEIFLWNVQL